MDDVSLGASNLFTLKTWSVAAAVNHLVAKNLLVQGRAAQLSFNARIDIPVDDSAFPMERKRVWRFVGAVSLPLGDAATIPVSITLASDPNSLKNEKYVTGHIGISYDFGALKTLFKPQAAGK